jgi:hypothetical protein
LFNVLTLPCCSLWDLVPTRASILVMKKGLVFCYVFFYTCLYTFWQLTLMYWYPIWTIFIVDATFFILHWIDMQFSFSYVWKHPFKKLRNSTHNKALTISLCWCADTLAFASWTSSIFYSFSHLCPCVLPYASRSLIITQAKVTRLC